MRKITHWSVVIYIMDDREWELSEAVKSFEIRFKKFEDIESMLMVCLKKVSRIEKREKKDDLDYFKERYFILKICLLYEGSPKFGFGLRVCADMDSFERERISKNLNELYSQQLDKWEKGGFE